MNDDTVIANQWPCTSGGDLGEEEKRLTSGRRQASGRALGHVGTGADSDDGTEALVQPVVLFHAENAVDAADNPPDDCTEALVQPDVIHTESAVHAADNPPGPAVQPSPPSPSTIEPRPEGAVDAVDDPTGPSPEGQPSPPSPTIGLRPEGAVDTVDNPIDDCTEALVQPVVSFHPESAVDAADNPPARYSMMEASLSPSWQPAANASPLESLVEDPMHLQLEHPDFMPFIDKFPNQHFLSSQHIQAADGIKERVELDLSYLLIGSFNSKENWMAAAKQLLWDSDTAPGVIPKFENEQIALCLKEVVWNEYRVANNARGRRGLFWIMDPMFPATKPHKKKSKPISLNIFSFRALFGAVLCTHGKEAALQLEQGRYPIHVAAEKLLPDAVSYLLNWVAYANMQNLVNQPTLVNQQSLYAKRTALHYAVRFWQQNEAKQKQQKTLVQILKAFKADHKAQDSRGHVPLFNAILTEDIDLIELLIEDSLINHADVDGDTHLHIAVDSQCERVVKLLIENGADPLLRNHDGQTPSHIAAQRLLSCLKAMDETCSRMGIELVSTFSQEDMLGNTPLDYAAIHNQKGTFQYMWGCVQRDVPPSVASYRPVVDRLYGIKGKQKIRLTTLQRTLEYLSKPMVQAVMTTETTEESLEQSEVPTEQHYQRASLYHLLECDENDSSPVVATALDKCLYGEKVVVSKVLDSDAEGRYPPRSAPDVVLRQFVSSHHKIWYHPTLKIWINSKWRQFGQWIMCLLAFFYLLQMLALTTAFCLAIRPGVTDETLNLYNTPLDQFRGFMEGVVIAMWLVKIFNEIQKFCLLGPKIYSGDIFVLINVSAILLLFVTFVLRAFQSKGQWGVAAVAFLAYSMLALEYFSLLRWSSTYIHTLFSIVKEDLTKFFVVFLVYLMGFAGAFLLAIQVYRDNIAAVQEAGGTVGGGADNTTVYFWNTYYLGLRVMLEGLSLLDYNGMMGWFPVLFYLSFLMVTVLILRNMLIAQMADTYTTVRSNARALSTFNRARFILRYLKFYENLQMRRNVNSCAEDADCSWSKETIIWKGQGPAPAVAGCYYAIFKAVRDCTKYLFFSDKIALNESIDYGSKQEAVTSHNMHLMLNKFTAPLKSDIRQIKRSIKAVQ